MSRLAYQQNIQDIAQFYMPHNPQDITRICKTQNDCAINAFEILNIINNEKASYLRKFVHNRPEIIGLTLQEILDIINKETDERKFEYTFYVKEINLNSIIKFFNLYLQPNHALFLLFRKHNVGHVVLLAKDNNNKQVIIDLQEKYIYCPITIKECLEYLQDKHKTYWGVIGFRKKYNYTDDIEMMLDDSDVFAFGIGSVASKALSLGKSALQQSKTIAKGIASQLKEEAKAQASQLKEEAKAQASQLKDEAKAQASQLKDEAKSQVVQQIQQI
jgi:hypothetical protein